MEIRGEPLENYGWRGRIFSLQNLLDFIVCLFVFFFLQVYDFYFLSLLFLKEIFTLSFYLALLFFGSPSPSLSNGQFITET